MCVSFLMKENELSQTCRAQKKCQSKKLCSPPSTIEDEEKTTFIFFFLISMNPQTERPCSCVIRTEWGLLSFLLIIKLYLSLAVWREKMRKRDLPYTHTHIQKSIDNNKIGGRGNCRVTRYSVLMFGASTYNMRRKQQQQQQDTEKKSKKLNYATSFGCRHQTNDLPPPLL